MNPREDRANKFLILIAISSLFSIFFFTGCTGSDILTPPAIVQLTSTESTPINVGTIDANFDTFQAEKQPSFKWAVLNKVGVEMKGWSVTYSSVYGENLDTLEIRYRKLFLRTEGGATGEITLEVFHSGVIDLMRANEVQYPFSSADTDGNSQVRSVLAPINAHVRLFFTDDHDHDFILETDIALDFQYKKEKKN